MVDAHASDMPRLASLARLAAHTRGMRQCAHYATDITCRGSGGVLRPQWGARGAKPARMIQSAYFASSARAGGAEPARSPLHASSAKCITNGTRGGAASHECSHKRQATRSARGGAHNVVLANPRPAIV